MNNSHIETSVSMNIPLSSSLDHPQPADLGNNLTQKISVNFEKHSESNVINNTNNIPVNINDNNNNYHALNQDERDKRKNMQNGNQATQSTSTSLKPVLTESSGAKGSSSGFLKSVGSAFRILKHNDSTNLINIKNRVKSLPPKTEKPMVHINLDVEILSINITESLFNMLGFIRFIFPIDKGTNELLCSLNSKTSMKITELKNGWTYDVRIQEDGASVLPVNLKFMFYNSYMEEIIYTDIYIATGADGKKMAAVNVRFRATMQQEFDLSEFPFDRQYLGIKINTRGQYQFAITSEEIGKIIPKSLSFMTPPFTCRTSYSMVGFSQVAAFADLAPPDVYGEKDSDGKYKIGKPLYYSLIERDSLFHYRAFVVPMALTMVSTLMILCTDPIEKDSYNDRNSLILALFLTLVGMKYILVQALPEGDQETILDEMMRIMFLILFAVSIETTVMHYFIGSQFQVEYNFNGLVHEVRILDAIFISGIFVYLFILQIQFLLLRTRLSNVLIHLFCCRFSRTISSTSLCLKIAHIGNHIDYMYKQIKSSICCCDKPYRETVRPWGDDPANLPRQLRLLQFQFYGREAKNKLSVQEVEKDSKSGIYETSQEQVNNFDIR